MKITNPKVESLKDVIIKKIQNGETNADVARFIQQKTALGFRQSKEWAKRLKDECDVIDDEYESDDEVYDEIVEDVEIESDLEFKKKYIYNKQDDKYLFLLHESIGKNVIVPASKIKSLIKNYSNFDGNPETINQICLSYNIPRNVLIHILKILGITHDSIPVTPEDLIERDEDDIIEECIQDKRFSLYQKLQKRDWQQTKEDAKKWNELVAGKLDPIKDCLDNWTPPKATYDYSTETSNRNVIKLSDKKTFLCVLTDTHIGELTKHVFNNNSYNSKKAIENIFNYLNQIAASVNERTYLFDKCVLVCLGDILNSCLDGLTRKGTPLENDLTNEDLFDVGLDVLVSFICGLKRIFKVVDIKATKGNHDSTLVYAVYRACEKYFEGDKNVNFYITKKYLDSFKIYNNFFIFTHGGHDTIKTAIPRSENALENYFQGLLLSNVEQLIGIKSRYVLSGHTHSFKLVEKNSFEHIICSASVNADDFAENLGYHSKPRQQSFIVEKDQIKEIINYHF